ncbi:class I tRNA ligase family protein [Candidatus Babeliales bacterium]|nr:class I tRNA ligase family protein [Candidatus Babeliales bacterium]
MKNKIFFSYVLFFATGQIQPLQLTNSLLKAADGAGMFDRAIIDILQVRQKIKELIIGKFMWRGAACSLTLFNQAKNKLSYELNIITKRPEALFGATFVVISVDHPDLFSMIDDAHYDNATNFVTQTQKRNLLDRYEHPDFTIISTGTFAQHPITKEFLPIFVGDYCLEGYDNRITNAHLAIPAHDVKDFQVAQNNKLPIQLVITSHDETKSSSCPQINKTTKQLIAAYPGEYSDCVIINSEFLNGNIKASADKAIAFLKSQNLGSEYKEPLLYHFMNKSCSINDLQAIETLLTQENKTLSTHQKEAMLILMLQVQSDFLSIVEHFLINARESKELMIELIEESCALRNNKNAYILHWAQLKTNEPEKIIFKRDINTFFNLCKFCAELIDFLGDFGSSCTHALANLKKLQNK